MFVPSRLALRHAGGGLEISVAPTAASVINKKLRHSIWSLLDPNSGLHGASEFQCNALDHQANLTTRFWNCLLLVFFCFFCLFVCSVSEQSFFFFFFFFFLGSSELY